jgi:hypothetical protein
VNLPIYSSDRLSLIKYLPLGRLNIWLTSALLIIVLLLSGCSSTSDYQTDLGDPSLYKELYVKATRENKSLQRKLDNVGQDNTKLKERYAKLKAQKLPNDNLSDREARLDDQEKALAERSAKMREDEEHIKNMNSENSNDSREIGKIIGQWEKDEELIPELRKELKSSIGSRRVLLFLMVLLIFIVVSLLGYIFLASHGILTPKTSESATNPRAINVSVIGNDEPSKQINSGNKPSSKALTARTTDD